LLRAFSSSVLEQVARPQEQRHPHAVEASHSTQCTLLAICTAYTPRIGTPWLPDQIVTEWGRSPLVYERSQDHTIPRISSPWFWSLGAKSLPQDQSLKGVCAVFSRQVTSCTLTHIGISQKPLLLFVASSGGAEPREQRDPRAVIPSSQQVAYPKP